MAEAASSLRSLGRRERGFEFLNAASCCVELSGQADDDLDAWPVDLQVAPQSTSEEHCIHVDTHDVVALLDEPFLDEADDELVVALDELE
ncbi:MAG: hypothetical protein WDO74_00490 [Pseudomonadota bacterium]